MGCGGTGDVSAHASRAVLTARAKAAWRLQLCIRQVDDVDLDRFAGTAALNELSSHAHARSSSAVCGLPLRPPATYTRAEQPRWRSFWSGPRTRSFPLLLSS